jgi:hypothetical protein
VKDVAKGSAKRYAVSVLNAKIEWMGFAYKVWRSNAIGSGEGWSGASVDLVHPLNGFNVEPWRAFKQLLVKHLQRRFSSRCDVDVIDWQEGLLHR